VSLFCRALLNSGECILTCAALHFCCLTAHLYEEQISIGAIAVTQACCEPVLQSTTEQWGIDSAQTCAALHFCCLTAHLYEEQISIGAIAVTQACCEPVLQSTVEQWGMHFDLCRTAFLLPHCTSVRRASIYRCHCSGTSLL